MQAFYFEHMHSRRDVVHRSLFSAVQRLGAARASLLTTTDPLWALLFAALLLGEPLGPSQLAGGALILGGALLAQWRPREVAGSATV